jgi:hypothetical protein
LRLAELRHVPGDLAAASRMADVDSIPKIEMLDHGGCIGSVVVHVVADADLRGAAVSAAVMRGGASIKDRDRIIVLAAQQRLPAVYSISFFVEDGGLISYGPSLIEQYRRAAGYVDRILKGEKPAELPVQAPTKYELVINRKTAKTLGLTVPPTLLARADTLIE